MSQLLVGHELDQISICRREASSRKVQVRKATKPAMEQIQLNPLEVQCKGLNVSDILKEDRDLPTTHSCNHFSHYRLESIH